MIDTSIGEPGTFANAQMVDVEVEDANEIGGILSYATSAKRGGTELETKAPSLR